MIGRMYFEKGCVKVLSVAVFAATHHSVDPGPIYFGQKIGQMLNFFIRDVT